MGRLNLLICGEIRLLTVQAAGLLTHPGPTRAALIHLAQIYVVHLLVHRVVGCPEEENIW